MFVGKGIAISMRFAMQNGSLGKHDLIPLLTMPSNQMAACHLQKHSSPTYQQQSKLVAMLRDVQTPK